MFPAVRLGFLPLLLLLAGAQPVAAQTPTLFPPMQSPAVSADLFLSTAQQQPATPTPPVSPTTDPKLPVDLNRIKTGVMRTAPIIFVDKDTLRIYVNTVAPTPKFTDMILGFNLFNGPVPYAGMTHQDFLQSTRPKDMYSAGGFGVKDMLRFAALSYVEGKAFELLRKGALALRQAKTEAERKEVQSRIEKELAALQGAIKSDIK